MTSRTSLLSPLISLRHYLRDATADAHARLDAQLDELRIFEKQLNYSCFLSGMESLYLSYGGSLDWASAAAGLAPRSAELVASIRRDHGIARLPLQALSSGAATASERWGAAYVLEGSAMGAQLLARHARRQLPPGSSIDYLETLSATARLRWPKFAAALDDCGADPDAAASSARAVFRQALRLMRVSASLS